MKRAAVLICGVGLQENKKTVLPESGELSYFPSLMIGFMKQTTTGER